MAKAQKKKAPKGKKPAAKKAKVLRKKAAPKKPAKPAKTPVKPAKKSAKPAKTAKSAPKKERSPAKKVVEKVKKAAKTIATTATKVVRPVKATPPTPVPNPAAPPAALRPPVPGRLKRAASPEAEKKRGRRARTRVHSNGTPVAAWLSTEKPRPASFIPAPPRAEAPSAIAAPPASSDRLIRPEDVAAHPSVRTVPVRIDVEQGAGRFHVLANPVDVALKVGEGIEWDFRYIGGADVTVDEIVIEFERPSPFRQLAFRTRKPGGARPHRQLSGPALRSSAGRRVQYTVRAMSAFRTEVARTNLVWMSVS